MPNGRYGGTPTLHNTIENEDLKQSNTFHSMSLELWDGDDVEYAIEKQAWKHNQAQPDSLHIK